MINVKNLNKHFGSNHIIKDLNNYIAKDEKVVIVGPSGSGKSTFLRCLNLLEQPTSGEIWFEGNLITDKNSDINLIRRKMGMVFQQFNLFPHMTVLENIIFSPVKLKILNKSDSISYAHNLLARIGLLDKKDCYPSMISGGQKQRIAIIRSLAMSPDVMLFDEPTSALDPEMVGEVLSLISELANEGMTMVIVTHEMGFAKEIGTRILFMDHGCILEDSAPNDFFNNSSNIRLKEFISKII